MLETQPIAELKEVFHGNLAGFASADGLSRANGNAIFNARAERSDNMALRCQGEGRAVNVRFVGLGVGVARFDTPKIR